MRAALRLTSPDGTSYAERIDDVKTEQQLSEIFEDFIGMVPLGKTFFADSNPVRTGGPMQVSIAFAEAHAAAKRYPYPMAGTVRHEVFTRRGGMYFGIAHLLDYPASPYDKPRVPLRRLQRRPLREPQCGIPERRQRRLGHAARARRRPAAARGDAIRPPGGTELAAGSLATRHRHEREQHPPRPRSRRRPRDSIARALYERVFALAERLERRPLPRAVVPRIALQGPKITRKLTTEWFAQPRR